MTSLTDWERQLGEFHNCCSEEIDLGIARAGNASRFVIVQHAGTNKPGWTLGRAGAVTGIEHREFAATNKVDAARRPAARYGRDRELGPFEMSDHRIETQFQFRSGKHKTIPGKPHGPRGKRLIVVFAIGDLITPQAGAPASQLGIAEEHRFLADLSTHRIGAGKRGGRPNRGGWRQLGGHSQGNRFDGEQSPWQERKGACNKCSDDGRHGRVVWSRHGVVIIET